MRTFQIPSKNVVCSLPLIKSGYVGSVRYSLFKKVDGRWFQVRTVSYVPEMAYRVWADFIALNPKVYSIRRASFDYNEAKQMIILILFTNGRWDKIRNVSEIQNVDKGSVSIRQYGGEWALFTGVVNIMCSLELVDQINIIRASNRVYNGLSARLYGLLWLCFR